MQSRWRSLPFFALLTAGAVIVGLAAAASAAAQESAIYRIGSRDTVEVQVDEMPEIDRELEVRSDGTILLPVIGGVEARGRTEDELARQIRTRLEQEGLRRATVRVRVTGFLSRPVSVLGAVPKPGLQNVPGSATLVEVLLAAGFTGGPGQEVRIRRRAENGLADEVKISSVELFELGEPAVNLPIFAGDVLFVSPVPTVRISVLGAVRRPGVVELEGARRTTLLVVLAEVGGLSDAAASKIRIRRRQDGEETEIVASYRRILDGKEADVELQDGDVVLVKEAFF